MARAGASGHRSAPLDADRHFDTGDRFNVQPVERARIVVRGAVQGVGFRPFVYRLATDLGLAGWVLNSSSGVFIEVEGAGGAVASFIDRIERERPARAFVQSLEATRLDPAGYAGFTIRPSVEGDRTALILPDIATCPDCLRELLDPANRRHRYPFINCTNCGPRYSIIEALPYDRPKTTMGRFVMCEACRAEYVDPLDRRFHAQPTACPACGPHLEAWTPEGRARARHDPALAEAVDEVRRGGIVAIKGLGGFHLVVDARRDDAVARLRAAKRREEKPFALMYPSIEAVRADCEVSPAEARLLESPESPIVLLRKRGGAAARHAACGDGPSAAGRAGISVADAVAPGNPTLGVMLPYTPLHHLLLADLGFPVVATSGNVSDEPICTDEAEAVSRLRGMADLFLVHNRPIARHVDDSVVRVVAGREQIVRRARGYAPLPVPLDRATGTALAVGAHLKNSIALRIGANAFVSQHIGDLETPEAFEAFRRVIDNLGRLYGVEPDEVACDLHPEYLSTRHARQCGRPVREVQHHVAHVLSCMADNHLEPPALGVAWDGTGLGSDGSIWGGEFFHVTAGQVVRAAHLRTFPLPGGDVAVREPRRAAIGLLHEIDGAAAFDRATCAPVAAFGETERRVIRRMLESAVNSPRTSSAGRLFDAVASLAGLCQRVRYEGQAAMELEFALGGEPGGGASDEAYPFEVTSSGEVGAPLIVDWEPLVRAVVGDVTARVGPALVSRRFHNALAEIIIVVARRVGESRVVLSGGCFQNRYLTERTVARLAGEGFRPYWHQRVPPNDGGIALGQLAAMAWGLASR